MKSNETLFLSCSVVVPSKELEEIRQMVIKQMEEGVVILPYYLTMVSPRVLDELEEIKEDLEKLSENEWNKQVGADKGLELAIDVVEDRISELKGKNK